MFMAEGPSVSELGKRRVDTEAEGMLVCKVMFVSLNPEVKWKNGSVSDLVVSKWLDNDLEDEVPIV